MENPEEVLHSLDEFAKLKPKDIPKELDDYLLHVASTGDPVYQWSLIKALFRQKLLNVITEFYETCPVMDIPPCPNVDPFNYETMKSGLLERFDSFASAPFTIQRISELLTEPRKQYKRVDKYMRAVEKNIWVVSTREPGRREQNTVVEATLMNGVAAPQTPPNASRRPKKGKSIAERIASGHPQLTDEDEEDEVDRTMESDVPNGIAKQLDEDVLPSEDSGLEETTPETAKVTEPSATTKEPSETTEENPVKKEAAAEEVPQMETKNEENKPDIVEEETKEGQETKEPCETPHEPQPDKPQPDIQIETNATKDDTDGDKIEETETNDAEKKEELTDCYPSSTETENVEPQSDTTAVAEVPTEDATHEPESNEKQPIVEDPDEKQDTHVDVEETIKEVRDEEEDEEEDDEEPVLSGQVLSGKRKRDDDDDDDEEDEEDDVVPRKIHETETRLLLELEADASSSPDDTNLEAPMLSQHHQNQIQERKQMEQQQQQQPVREEKPIGPAVEAEMEENYAEEKSNEMIVEEDALDGAMEVDETCASGTSSPMAQDTPTQEPMDDSDTGHS